MAINVANEYKKKLAEQFSTGSKTNDWAGKAYDFVGVKSIQIWTIEDPLLIAYNRLGDATTGLSRFGKVTDVQDTYQTLEMNESFALTRSIDKANAGEQYNVKKATQVLQTYNRLGFIPAVDMRRLYKWATGNGLPDGHAVQINSTKEALTSANILTKIFEANAALSDKLVPLENRVLFISETEYVKLNLASVVIGGSQLNAGTVRKGYSGTIDNINVVRVPSSYMPTNVGFILKYKNATVDPIKLRTLRIQKDPIGVDGDVIEMHMEYDAFVVDTWRNGVYVYKTADSTIAPATGESGLISTSTSTST